MRKNFNLVYFSLLLAMIFQTACNSSKESPLNDQPQNPISIIDNTGIEFQYELGDTIQFGKDYQIDINCFIKNNTKNKINYLCQTCNRLEYYLDFKPSCYEVMPWLNCDITRPEIDTLNAGDSIEFNTYIFKPKDSELLENVNLDLRVLDRFVTLYTLIKYPELIEKTYRADISKDNLIQSNNH